MTDRPLFDFKLRHTDAQSAARRGTLQTPHGAVETPAFMPVGTQGSVKGLTADMIWATGAAMILGNTYHLALRPGEQLIERLGGLHRFMAWNGPILTDSGGFQVFSLGDQVQIDETAAVFRSHIDGRRVELSPERAIAIQQSLGSDIAMVLDHVVALPADPAAVEDACRRSVRWAERCRRLDSHEMQVQFAIVQGGLDPELRIWCAEQLVQMDFFGYAIGGLSVGEEMSDMYRMLDVTCPVLPRDRPRYLMGVGRPQDMLEAIRRGVDLFDCVMPTRNGRNAMAFTDQGSLRLRNARYQEDPRSLDSGIVSAASRYSRAYLRHLFMAGEMLGPVLVSIHNLTYYQRLMARARQAIEHDRFEAFYARQMASWKAGD